MFFGDCFVFHFCICFMLVFLACFLFFFVSLFCFLLFFPRQCVHTKGFLR